MRSASKLMTYQTTNPCGDSTLPARQAEQYTPQRPNQTLAPPSRPVTLAKEKPSVINSLMSCVSSRLHPLIATRLKKHLNMLPDSLRNWSKISIRYTVQTGRDHHTKMDTVLSSCLESGTSVLSSLTSGIS